MLINSGCQVPSVSDPRALLQFETAVTQLQALVAVLVSSGHGHTDTNVGEPIRSLTNVSVRVSMPT